MISYELALKLKEAGFPKKEIGCKDCEFVQFYDDEGTYWNTMQMEISEDSVYIPTLEELIEACGHPFVLFSLFNGRNWIAGKAEAKSQDFQDEKYPGMAGTSADEAVANLYLRINQK